MSLDNVRKILERMEIPSQDEVFSYANVPGPEARDGEEEFVENYDPTKYGVSVDDVVNTADAVVLTVSNDLLSVLLVKRGGHPFKGFWALPGGFVDRSDATYHGSAVRELLEETGVEDVVSLGLVSVYNHPGRDPRMVHMVSNAYLFFTKNCSPKAADDAIEAKFFPLTTVLGKEFPVAFDHKLIIRDAADLLKLKLVSPSSPVL